jgi:hypothetical protein
MSSYNSFDRKDRDNRRGGDRDSGRDNRRNDRDSGRDGENRFLAPLKWAH